MKKYTHLIYFLVFTAGIVLAVFGCFYMSKKITASLDAQEKEVLEQQIQNEQIENIPQLAKTYDNILQNERYFSFIYSEDKVVEVIKDIERIAKEESVGITITQKEVPKKKAVPTEAASASAPEATPEVTPDTPPVEVKPKELADSLPYEKHIRLEVKAEGQYLAIRNFLQKLETAPYALDVISMSATLAPPDEDALKEPVSNETDDSPFLLQGEVNPEEVTVVPEPKIQDVIATFEMALYTK